jgi:alcohol dehydrogenase YqhD (iron-dependent ADH family)
MIIKEDFYKIVNIQDDSIIQEAIADGIKSYLEKLGFDSQLYSYNINIEIDVDESRIAKQVELLGDYAELLYNELDSPINDDKMKEYLQAKLDAVEEVLNKW